MNQSINTSFKNSIMRWKLSFGLLVLILSLGFMAPAVAEMVNINKADAAALQENLQGVGPVKANAIVDYRKKNGSFKSIDELQKVPGIGPGMIKKNKRNLSTSRGLVRAEEVRNENTKKSSNNKSAKKAKDSDDDDKDKSRSNKKDKDLKLDKKKSKTDKKDSKSKMDKKKIKSDKKASKSKTSKTKASKTKASKAKASKTKASKAKASKAKVDKKKSKSVKKAKKSKSDKKSKKSK